MDGGAVVELARPAPVAPRLLHGVHAEIAPRPSPALDRQLERAQAPEQHQRGGEQQRVGLARADRDEPGDRDDDEQRAGRLLGEEPARAVEAAHEHQRDQQRDAAEHRPAIPGPEPLNASRQIGLRHEQPRR